MNEPAESIAQFFRDLIERDRQEKFDRSEMYLQVGRAIVALSEVEEILAEIFVFLSAPMPEARSAKMFYSVQNIAHKIELVDWAMMHSPSAKDKERWRKLSSRVVKQKMVRNTAAHASVQFQREKESKKWRISIGTQARDPRAKRDLAIADVKAAADDLHDIWIEMRRFLMRLVQASENARLSGEQQD
jgi:hypothetical protein